MLLQKNLVPLLTIGVLLIIGCGPKRIDRNIAEKIAVEAALQTEGWGDAEVFHVEVTNQGFEVTVDKRPGMPGGHSIIHVSKQGKILEYEGGK